MVGGDCSRMKFFNVTMTQYIELQGMALKECETLEQTSLQHLSEHYLKYTLDKSGQTGDYLQDPLPQHLQKYAAIDGLVSRLICAKIISKLKVPFSNTILEQPTGLKEGDEVELFIGGEVVASVKVLYIAEVGDGITRKWGTTTINAGKA